MKIIITGTKYGQTIEVVVFSEEQACIAIEKFHSDYIFDIQMRYIM